MATLESVESILTDIARELDYLGREAARRCDCTWSSMSMRAMRTLGGFIIQFKPVLIDTSDIYISGYISMYKLVDDLVAATGPEPSQVHSITGKIDPAGNFSLAALAQDGLHCGESPWQFCFDVEADRRARQSTAQELAEADAVDGVPAALVPGLRALNAQLRRQFLLHPPHEIAAKFWRIEDSTVFLRLIEIFQEDMLPEYLDGAPCGFHDLMSISLSHAGHKNEGLPASIDLLGRDFYARLSDTYRAAGMEAIADGYDAVLRAHKAGRKPGVAVGRKVGALDDALGERDYRRAVWRYFTANPQLFESPL